jgi:transposase
LKGRLLGFHGEVNASRLPLVVTKEGIPLSYEVFDGNRTDVTTVEEIVGTMENQFGVADRVWVMDRGMASEENLEWLREGDRKYVIGAVKGEMRKFEAELLDKTDWKNIREGIEVKQCEDPAAGKPSFCVVLPVARGRITGFSIVS